MLATLPDDDVALIVELEERKKSGHVRLHPARHYPSQAAGGQTTDEVVQNARRFILLQRERIENSIDLSQIPKDVKVCAIPAATSGKRSPDMSVSRGDRPPSVGGKFSHVQNAENVLVNARCTLGRHV